MLHIVCGDLAQGTLQSALGPAARIKVLRDDLAIGPLDDIDQPPCAARVEFWNRVFGEWPDKPDLAEDLAQDARWLAQLQEEVTVWHGDSCSEQLLLARVAAALGERGPALWEVACGVLPQQPRRPVSLCPPDLLTQLPRQPVLPARRAHLADSWRQQCADNAEVRLWQGDTLHSQAFAQLDQALLAACARFSSLARAMAQVMADTRGFYPTDLFLLWRARELESRGHLRLSGGPGEYGYRDLQVQYLSR